MDRTVALAPLTVLPCTPLEQIDAAAQAGFNAVSLRVFAVMDTDIRVVGDPNLQQAIRERLRSNDLDVLDVEVARATADLDVADLDEALEFSASVGAERFAITPAADGQYDAATEAAVVDRIGQLCEAADKHGVGVMLEVMAYRSIRSLSHALTIREKVAHPRLAITIDALHLFRSGGDVEQVRAMDRETVACVQLCDAPAGPPSDLAREARYGRLYPGDGDFPLKSLLGAVASDVPVSVEVPSPANDDLTTMARAARAIESARSVMAT